jgi:hypothetical protein
MDHLAPLLALIVFAGAICLFNAWLLRTWAGVDGTTAFLGTLPGGAAAVVAMSAELDVDRLLVTVLMYVRVILVIVLTPLILAAVFLDGPVRTAPVSVLAMQPAADTIALTVLLALAGALAARPARLPSPNFLGPFLLMMILKIAFPALRLGLPEALFPVGLLLLGGAIGMPFDLRRVAAVWKPALIQVGLVTMLVVACMAAGYAFHRCTGVELLTAVLGATPGGKEAMIATSIAMGGNVEMVMTMQTLRYMLVLLLGPSLAAWMARHVRPVRADGPG